MILEALRSMFIQFHRNISIFAAHVAKEWERCTMNNEILAPTLEEYLKKCETDHAANFIAGMHMADPKQLDIGGVPYVVIPAGSKIEEFAERMDRPKRITANREFFDPESFCDYVKEFNITKKSRIYANYKERAFRAVIEDHQPDSPSWCSHSAVLKLTHSPEWIAWFNAARDKFNQQELAEFFEANIKQIAEPDAADLLGGVRNIQMANNWRCVSAHREGGDISFSMQRENSANTTIGNNTNAKIPARLTLMIFPFMFWNQYSIKVMLNYKLEGEKITFAMKLLDVDDVVNTAFSDVCDYVKKETDLKVLL